MGDLKAKFESLDWQKWLKNTALFLAPAVLLMLLTLQSGGTLAEGAVALRLWGLNTAVDLVRKFIAANPQE